MTKLRYSTQTISKEDIANVSKVLKSEFLTQGPKTIEFEKLVNEYEEELGTLPEKELEFTRLSSDSLLLVVALESYLKLTLSIRFSVSGSTTTGEIDATVYGAKSVISCAF